MSHDVYKDQSIDATEGMIGDGKELPLPHQLKILLPMHPIRDVHRGVTQRCSSVLGTAEVTEVGIEPIEGVDTEDPHEPAPDTTAHSGPEEWHHLPQVLDREDVVAYVVSTHRSALDRHNCTNLTEYYHNSLTRVGEMVKPLSKKLK